MADYIREDGNLYQGGFGEKKGALTSPDAKQPGKEDLERHALSPLKTTVAKFERQFFAKLQEAIEFYGSANTLPVAQAKAFFMNLLQDAQVWERVLTNEISKYEHMNFFPDQELLKRVNLYKEVLDTFFKYRFDFQKQDSLYADLGIFLLALELKGEDILNELKTRK